MKVIIMAGGKGTRIASVAGNIPKPMISVGGKPVLEHLIDNLRSCQLTNITLVTGHLSEAIRNHFGNGHDFGVDISYFTEDHPLGTAGALFQMSGLDSDFLLLCGDVLTGVDFNRFISFHRHCGAWASLMAHPNDHPFDSSLLVTETLPPQQPGTLPVDTHRVTAWLNKEDSRQYYQNRVNAGIEILSPRLLEATRSHFVPRHPKTPDKIDLDRDVLKPAIGSGRIYAYDTPEYIKDMGTPDRLQQVEHDLLSGRVAARNLSHRQRAVFLDRDGTINVYKGFLSRAADLELLPGAAQAIRLINQSGFLAIVVSNQPVIARGDCTFDELRTIHNKMETLLGKEGAYVDAIYYCPHHPDSGFAGERADYKVGCSCRKPQPGLLLKAAEEWNIDLAESYIIGDSDRDTQAGRTAGCKASLLIATNQPFALVAAVKRVLSLT